MPQVWIFLLHLLAKKQVPNAFESNRIHPALKCFVSVVNAENEQLMRGLVQNATPTRFGSFLFFYTSQKVNIRLPKTEKQNKHNKKNKACGHSWEGKAVSQTLGCL